ncbi:MAG: hypothetical protein E6I74_13335 [Chloroflexi bacterium]|nr:MAG: hypothetical protein E6I74_13335 [Chloroflexota bacterium]
MPSPLRSNRLQGWVPAAITILVVLLLVGLLGHHPQLARQEALGAALDQQAQQKAHHAAKLVRESDLERAASRSGENIGHDTSLTTSSG